MTAGDKMHARMERHRQMQQERKLYPEVPYSGPWARDVVESDGSNLARNIRAEVERRQNANADDEEETADEDTSMSSLPDSDSTTSARSEYDRLAATMMRSLKATDIPFPSTA